MFDSIAMKAFYFIGLKPYIETYCNFRTTKPNKIRNLRQKSSHLLVCVNWSSLLIQ